MQTFEQWWNENWNCYIGEDSKFSAEEAWDTCAKQYEHKIKNIEQAKNLRIQVLEKLLVAMLRAESPDSLEELRKDFEILAESRTRLQK